MVDGFSASIEQVEQTFFFLIKEHLSIIVGS